MKYFEIKNLEIILDNFSLKNISFQLNKNDYLAIIGPTGAGKTVLLESIVGISPLKQGQIILENKDITKVPPEKRKIGIIYQDFALFPHLKIFENIAYGVSKKESKKIFEIAEILKISHLLDRYPETLSGGEQQRVAMARALIVEPKLLLMDEPLSSLDNKTKIEIRNFIKKIKKELNLTIIHITHDLNDVWSLANKLAVIKDGNLIQFGDVKEIANKPEPNFVAEFINVNILDGEVINYIDNLTEVKINNFSIFTIDKATVHEKVKIAIRPENILIFNKEPNNISARNIIEGKIYDYYFEGNVVYLIVDINSVKLKALLTINAFDELKIEKNKTIFIGIKATNIRIV